MNLSWIKIEIRPWFHNSPISAVALEIKFNNSIFRINRSLDPNNQDGQIDRVLEECLQEVKELVKCRLRTDQGLEDEQFYHVYPKAKRRRKPKPPKSK